MINSEWYPPIGDKEYKGILHPFPKSYCDLLLKNKVILSKRIGNRVYVSKQSIENFKNKFNIEDYYTTEECDIKLLENQFKYDYFLKGGIPNPTPLGYEVSVKKLYEKNYFQKDKYISKYILKSSFDKCIETLKKELYQIKRAEMINDRLPLSFKIEIDSWKYAVTQIKDREKHSITTIEKPKKPTLSNDKMLSIEKVVDKLLKDSERSFQSNETLKKIVKTPSIKKSFKNKVPILGKRKK